MFWGVVSSDATCGPPLGRGGTQSAALLSTENELLHSKMATGGILSPDFENHVREFEGP